MRNNEKFLLFMMEKYLFKIHKKIFLLLIFLSFFISGSSKSLGHECDPSLIYKACGTNERCIPKANNTYYCICKRNFVETGGECVEISTTAAASVDPTNRHTNEESTSSSNKKKNMHIFK